MNDQQLEKKVLQDAARIKKDLDALVRDSAARLSRYEADLSHATGKTKTEVTTWAADSAAQLGKGLEKLSGDVKESVGDAASTVKKDVSHRLSQYDTKVRKVADQLPDGFGKRVARYPWVAISIGLFVGFLLGSLFKPAPRPLG